MFYLWDYIWQDLGSTDGTADGKFEVLLLGDSIGSIYGLKVVFTEGTELWISDGKVVDTKFGKNDGTDLGLS